jgi:hypothetical protein
LLGKARWQQRATVGHVILIGKIEQRFQPGREQQHSLAPGIDLARQRTFGHGQRAAPLQFGFGAEQIGQPFRLVEIDPAMEKGAAGELARFRRAQTGQAAPRASTAAITARPPWRCSSALSSRSRYADRAATGPSWHRAGYRRRDRPRAGTWRGAAPARSRQRAPAQVRLVDH